jgi:pimeloyl-ACP methyl ester carboxylesterase
MTTMSRHVRAIALLLLVPAGCIPAEWGANAILHPHRRAVTVRPDLPFEDVLLYDGRAHGESGGEAVTYGAFEKEDLRCALDAVGAERAILFGCSLGASVALQAAPLDPRIAGVIAQSPFADLRSTVYERKPAFLTRAKAEAALALAARQGRFEIDDASVLRAAPTIRVPVLLIHGGADRDTSPAHSRRIFDALTGPKEMLIVDGAGHNDALAGAETWRKIDAWLARLR